MRGSEDTQKRIDCINADTTMGTRKLGRKILRPLFERIRSWPVPLLPALEWCRDSEAEDELNWLPKQSGLKPHSVATLVLNAAGGGRPPLRAGERLACVPPMGMATEPAPAAGTFGMAG